MKIRQGFVSNSSSSSFSINRRYLSQDLIDKIVDHERVADGQQWSIEITDSAVSGYTDMDNFDMHGYLISIGVPEDAIQYAKD